MTSTISNHADKLSPTFVVGGAGRLGQMLTAHWPKGADLVCSSRTPVGDIIKLDLMLEPEKAVDVMAGMGAVICLAGVTPAAALARNELFSRNTDLALAAIHAAHKAGAGRVFVTSSAAVYGAVGGLLDEGAHCHPVSEYGVAKLGMEKAALALGKTLDHPVTVLRIGNVAGADAILGGWREGMTIDQLPDASTPKRSYIGPVSLAQALHGLTQLEDLPDVLNIASPGAVEMGALLDAAGLPWAPRPAPDTVIADVTLSTKRLQALVPLDPHANTPTGLVAEWRCHQTTIESP